MAHLPRKFEEGSTPYLPCDRLSGVGLHQLLCTGLNSTSRHAETINAIIKDAYVPTMQKVEVDEKTYGPPSQIPWSVFPYPTPLRAKHERFQVSL